MGVKTLSSGLKYCSKCNIEQPVENFQKYKGKIMSWCNKCKTDKAKEMWKKKKANKWIN